MAVSTNRRGGVDVQGALGEFWKKNSSNVLPPILGLLGFLFVWQFLSGTGIIKLPPPTSVWTEERTRILLLYPFMNSKTYGVGLFWQTLASLERVAKGYTLAAAVGISMGVVVGTNPFLNKALDPIFQFLRMVAPLAWVPIALAALQQNEPAALFVIFITSVWPILINTAEGVRQIPDDYNNVAKVLQLSRKEYYINILFPSALPYIFTGLRIAIGLAWLAIIAAEIVMSGITGIGFFIWNAYQQNYISEILLAVFYIGAVGLMLDRLMAWLQQKIAPPQGK
ncbi:MAG: nitrate ABC transporter permease [Microcoleus sp. PH2017_10_PVI_O_A]|uniref:nitrate ABC transporter permease n=1 Tax=unclassified Microcoleus TaxID=2642155 RepID=UPI001E0BDA45|nr:MULTISPECIES: nitrate ABC transporter permease [unclassified Microcoleus]TAE82267.1 MAG: nitrate ABC transporter, permease protein [Oscillatoriales cyanobacterium]MCC3406787.1 nitrate ABC transporter permease [Microcoleus sp. PH2017_10_PVI_O_A]MCC3460922.1 nitrate ABC transporter permease [Microcoleus sp. PH2017_11_PCY_U_A]MCC3479444.1 nitrate ABC transporter permease [Microcoleus sp. PH2017_12_PCY_D_A]MCC3526839.1 nitrate ABC transporter permease [Microcoleus sp. PH2017_21_RUC_O_A]